MQNLYSEKWNVINNSNRTKADYPKNSTIHELFEKQVEMSAHDIAVIFDKKVLTYKELNSKANQLARLLREKGVRKNTIVGIMAHRSFEMMIGIMAIIKAGGAYLPISPDTPDKRIEYFISDSGIDILLTQSKFIGKCNSFSLTLICMDDESIYVGSDENIIRPCDSNDLIYVIYTSGSTGNPKGVMIEHYSVVNRLVWMQERYPIGRDDTLLQKTPFMFDVSVWELFWWAITGSKVCILQPECEKFPQAIIEAVENNNITIMHFVPSMMNSFLNYIENADEVKRIKSLKRVFCSGEPLTVPHVKKFNQIIYEENSTKLTNLYGPTEATVDVTYYDCPTDGAIEKVPIGKPINNTTLYVMENNVLCSVGQVGELCIAGDGLARGYLNNPILTEEKFIDNPAIKNQRIYRTGDLTRWLSDGNIEFLCRIDNQVKIRGLRIELEEIENVITNHNAIDQCVVVVKDIDNINPQIVAYIIPKTDFELNDVKSYIKQRLPGYMIPVSFVTVSHFPLMSNGKIDRKALIDN